MTKQHLPINNGFRTQPNAEDDRQLPDHGGHANRKVSELYDLIHPHASTTATVRSVSVIDPAKKMHLTLTYAASTGRHFDELLRVIDSLQLTECPSTATPANWKDGDDVVIAPSLQAAQR